jgi:hypothetical protein
MAGPYEGATFLLTTKHAKSLAIGPAIWRHLGASVLEQLADTDQLGTFSGEVERQGSALESARRKCEWGLGLTGSSAEIGLASEGSFGPHPAIPFLPCDHEILYFIDRKRGFHLHVESLSEKTNYQMMGVSTWDELHDFAQRANFPSHALILRPEDRTRQPLFKGIMDESELQSAFEHCSKVAPSDKVWVETDMRAHLNPTRMIVIAELAEVLARRLAALCPSCHAPGWGKTDIKKGLPCEYCGLATEMIKSEIHSCVLCSHQQTVPRPDGLLKAPQQHCSWCNP